MDEIAVYAMMKKMIEQIRKDNQIPDRWIDGEEAMRVLRVTSKTTLQKLRDTGAIRFSQPEKKIILYDRESIMSYIERHVREPF